MISEPENVFKSNRRQSGTGLRVKHSGLAPGSPIRLSFDGQPIDALQGETIAAALTAAGISTFGYRRDGSPRGLWCGMGVCQECLVNVDGVPSIRACMAVAASGMKITSQRYQAELLGDSQTIVRSRSAPETRSIEVLVVGAGPAGLAAAEAAVRCGTRVLVLDERVAPGGQYFKQPAKSHAVVDARLLDRQAKEGREQIAKVGSLGVEIATDAIVWGAFGAHDLAATVAGRQVVFAPQRLIVATGAYERGVPVPGWTLPGYMTTGAAQTLLRSYRVLPGQRILVAGNGPLNLQLAAELVRTGATVVAVVEAARKPGVRELTSLAQAVSTAPGLMLKGLSYLSLLHSSNVPVLYESAVVEARGRRRVETCTVARIDPCGRTLPGYSQEFDVDTVCTGYGFRPSNEILRAIGCRHMLRNGELSTLVDGDGLTSIDNVYAVGDVVALIGAQAAGSQGFIAGCAALRSLGRMLPHDVERDLAEAKRRARRHRSFQQALWRLFAAPPLFEQFASDETVVCRCESVDRARIQAGLRLGANSLGAIKRRTRAAMGGCQGRYCEPLLATLASAAGVEIREELDHLAPRVPIKPIRIDQLV